MTGFRIVLALAEQNNVAVSEILGNDKAQRLVRIRAQAAHAMREMEYSASRIGRVLKRDHSSIVHLLQTRKPDGSLRHGTGTVSLNLHRGTRI